MAAYTAALAGDDPEPQRRLHRAAEGTWRWLCEEYLASGLFTQKLAPSTRLVRRRILESTWNEPLKPGSPLLFGDMPVKGMTRRHITVLRDRKAEFPAAADNRLKAVSKVLSLAVKDGLIPSNPALGIERLSVDTGGHHTWSIEKVVGFQAAHPLGTTPRLALDLLLYTGARRADVVKLGPQNVRDGWLSYIPTKTQRTSRVRVEIPLLPILQRTIEVTPSEALTFLLNQQGRPFSAKGFGNRIRSWCNAAGLPHHCTAHGLRKAGATLAAEEGATVHQLMAIYGWTTVDQAEIYTRTAERRRMAGAAMGMIALPEERLANADCPTAERVGQKMKKPQ